MNISRKISFQKIVSESKVTEIVKLLLPKSWISDIQEAFTILDYKADGILGSRDVKVTLRALGIEPTAAKLKMLVERSATNKPSGLSRDDYEDMILHTLNDIDSEEQMLKAFRAFDESSTRNVTYDDLKRIAEQLPLDVTNEEIKEMIDFADEDKDGSIRLEEFIDSARKIF